MEPQPVEKYPAYQICSSHGKQISLLCREHSEVLCSTCAKNNHGKCYDVLAIEEAAKGSKTSTAMTNLEQNLDNILSYIQKGVEFQTESIVEIQDEKEKIKQEIEKVREQLNQLLGQVQEKIYTELDSKVEEYNVNLNTKKGQLEEKANVFTQLKEQTSKIKEVASDLECFIRMQKLQKDMNVEKKSIIKMLHEMEKSSISLNINSKIRSLQQNLKTFGKIDVQSKPASIKFIENQVEEAKITVPARREIENVALQLRRNLTLKTGDLKLKVGNCMILPQNKMLFADSTNGRLIIHNEDGSFSREIRGLDNVFDVTVIGSNKIAVTYGGPRQKIGLVNISTNRIERKLVGCVKHECNGLSHYDGKLYVVAYKEGIKVINLQGQVINTIPIDVTFVMRITVHQDRIYYIDNEKRDVICCDVTGDHIWTFEDKRELVSPYNDALTVDNIGNVIVATVEGLILVISNNGESYEILNTTLTSNMRYVCTGKYISDEIEEPTAVYYEKQTNILLLCGRDGRAKLFDVI